MRFAGVKELKQKTMDLLRASEKEDVIITAYGKPTAVLHHLAGDDLADWLIENDPAFKNRLNAAYADYAREGGITADELVSTLEKRREAKI